MRLPDHLRHPNTIAYPEKFFDSAQVIAAHSHLRWPDLSREWIRRQHARIARVDWESRLPVVLGPRKSRLSLFTWKQQKLLNKAREMERVPDLSALLKGKLQMLSMRSSSAGASDVRPSLVVEDTNVEPLAPNYGEKTMGKAKKRVAEGQQSASLEESVPLEEAPPSVDVSKNTGEGPVQTGSTEASPEERPKKRAKKKKSVEEGARRSIDGDRPDDLPSSEDPSRGEGKASRSEGEPRVESPSSERAAPTSATRKGIQSEGSLSKRTRVEFPDRVEFLYDEKTPLVFNPLQCAELTRQIRGGTRELPPIGDLYFKDECIDTAFMRQWLTTRRLRKKKFFESFEELEGKLKSDRLVKKELMREKTRLEQTAAALEKEKVELQEERDAVVEALVKERQHLRDSRIQEVTRERVKVQTAMADKSTRCLGRV
ncbi:hypothetical protein DY000_02037762 [Brassica cretica]|uniref:Aminotransferase-like plant mobile domain-containing protein n=1 Tax=Brassica cretica TaxID=69181 RepID=A0ABQ7BDT4_BRACR|nr:hypothetical protein DY000_02037762 [Brassica cretica]